MSSPRTPEQKEDVAEREKLTQSETATASTETEAKAAVNNSPKDETERARQLKVINDLLDTERDMSKNSMSAQYGYPTQQPAPKKWHHFFTKCCISTTEDPADSPRKIDENGYAMVSTRPK